MFARGRPFQRRRSLIAEASMRFTCSWLLIAVCWLAPSVSAQQPVSSVSLEAVRAGLQRTAPSLVLRTSDPPQPDIRPTRLGVFTLVPPETNGGIVSVRVPVGDLVMRAVRGVTSAQHRRAERAAERRVLADFRAFQARQRPQ